MTALVMSDTRPLTRRQRMLTPIATIGGLTLLTLALHVRDPHDHGSWGLCPLNASTGLYCPGCGGLRAVNDLTKGQVGAAASSNLLFVALLPFLVFALGVWALDRWRGTQRRLPMSTIQTPGFALIAVVVAFTVLRNLPVGGWLAP